MYIMDCKPLPMLPYALLEEEKIPLKKKKKDRQLSLVPKVSGSDAQKQPAPSLTNV